MVSIKLNNNIIVLVVIAIGVVVQSTNIEVNNQIAIGTLGVGTQVNIMNFMPYSDSVGCSGPVKGIGFGTIDLNCIVNTTFNSIYGYYYEGANHVNISSQSSEYCDGSRGYQIFSTGGKCQQYHLDGNYYKVYSSYNDYPDTPSHSYQLFTFTDDCHTLTSYWFATNGTTVQYDEDYTISYICENGLPYQKKCPISTTSTDNGSSDECSMTEQSIDCTLDYQTTINCSG